MLLKFFQQMVILLMIPMAIITMILKITLQFHTMMMMLGHLIIQLLLLHNGLIIPLTMILIIQFHQMKLGINPPILGHLILQLLQLHNGLIRPLLQHGLQPLLLSGQLHQLSGQLQAKLQHILIEKMMLDLINTDHLLYRRNSE